MSKCVWVLIHYPTDEYNWLTSCGRIIYDLSPAKVFYMCLCGKKIEVKDENKKDG